MKNLKTLPELKDAKGVYMYLSDGQTLIDGISSWWSAIHGYSHPDLNQVVNEQISKFAHIMLGGMSHRPAKHLAEKLVQITPEGLNHVFFSDSGSVGVEVALKMALQYWRNKGYSNKTQIISLKNGYHGDTFKAMEVSDDSDFNKAFSNVLTSHIQVSVPEGGYCADAVAVQNALHVIEGIFKKKSHLIACFILEPIVQCAGGFHIYSPQFLKALKDLAEQYHILLIADEVATGFGRTGKLFACEHAGITPDIMVLGKALTAGYMGHAATLVTDYVYEAFLAENYDMAFMHGPTFMGNALACRIALEGIRIFEREDYLSKIVALEVLLREKLTQMNSSVLKETRCIGGIAVMVFREAALLDGFSDFARNRGVWLRPIGAVLYIMPAYIIKDYEIERIFEVVKEWIEREEQS